MEFSSMFGSESLSSFFILYWLVSDILLWCRLFALLNDLSSFLTGLKNTFTPLLIFPEK